MEWELYTQTHTSGRVCLCVTFAPSLINQEKGTLVLHAVTICEKQNIEIPVQLQDSAAESLLLFVVVAVVVVFIVIVM